jgi:predicted transcriptional regulator
MATITATELAADLEVTPRTVRKFLRADAAANGTPTPGKGARYSIDSRKVPALKRRFNEWIAAKESDDEDDSSDS